MSPSASSDVDPEREIRRVHMMLEDWYRGIREDIDSIEAAMDAAFVSVGPDGAVQDRQESLASMAEERDAIQAAEGATAVEVEDLTHHRELRGLHLLTYEKRVLRDGAWEARRCSVWLRETDQAPAGLQWLHLQETPIPADADEAEAEA